MRRLLLLCFIGFIAASLAVLFFGDSGVTAYRALEAYRNRLSANVDTLTDLNGRLTDDLENLKGDPNRIEVLARELGLFKDGDRVVKLEGGLAPRVSYQVGNLLRFPRQREGRGATMKTVGAGVTSLLAALFLVLHVLFNKRGNRDHHRRRS
jgi:cell division protein FtsB